MLTTLAVSGYRSLVDVVVPLDPLTVITGANGTGKSNLYRALRLLAATGHGRAVAAVAREGGLDSVLWAGPETPQGEGAQGTRRTRPISVRLGIAADEVGYLIDLGLPQTDARSLFTRDPEIKREQLFSGPFARPGTLFVDRQRGGVRVRGDDGWESVDQPMGPGQSVLLDLVDGTARWETASLRSRIASWRFYDHFRTDASAPARRPQVGTRTRWLSDDGSDLAAVWATTTEAGRGAPLDEAVDRAFPGSRVQISVTDGSFRLQLRQPGLLRPLDAAELSDGTLRYLLWCAALLPADPPPLLVVNEPESSLHESLIDPLGSLLAHAASQTQVIVVTHSAPLRRALAEAGGSVVELESNGYGTRVRDQLPLERPSWHWPSR
ncbi:AAA family ATPase [Microbacterium galbinum]|uniref:AAA family ATPase n=1 Tax=Microbacterium galbinum TaxID=2851646 RepID=A0ABY4ILY1_9MICO|nr:AAA family ATPase [Microbacterium galbinum]UPL13092.1 AAA family ATPase [Microbacterium galbinum]